MKVAILGAGAMGTACAIILSGKRDYQTYLWTHLPDHAHQMRSERENKRFFPGYPLPENVHVSSDIDVAAEGAGLGLLAIPTVYLREALTAIADEIPASMPLASVAKGLEQQTFKRPSQIIVDVLGRVHPVCALSGPSHAEELALGKPASVVAAADDAELALLVQTALATDRFRIYTNDDLAGTELCGALKNVIAIAAGVCDGLGFGDNTKSALLTRGLVEMVRFVTALGGNLETCYGLAGIGDLMTTSFSPFGRNRAVGEKIGQGRTLDEILKNMSAVAEGVWTSRAVRDEALRLGLEMPITEQVCKVLFDGKDASAAVRDLMMRELKRESLN